MHPYPQPSHADLNPQPSAHRGPLSRTWPQLFKKRRRYSPVRESAQQVQPQPQPQQQAQVHGPVPIYAENAPVAAQALRIPSLVADTASTVSTLSQASTQPPPPKIPIARRTSSIATTESNGAGGVTTPQADLLASKSNYELISSGQHLEMGLHFSTAMATGVMMKRATHRAAEQARRDRMKTAMVDLAEFLLDGEVTFGSGTTCFVVMRGEGGAKDVTGDAESVGEKGGKKSVAGEKKTVNKARLIEMALEKMRAQEKEIEMLRKEMEDLRPADRMDVTE